MVHFLKSWTLVECEKCWTPSKNDVTQILQDSANNSTSPRFKFVQYTVSVHNSSNIIFFSPSK